MQSTVQIERERTAIVQNARDKNMAEYVVVSNAACSRAFYAHSIVRKNRRISLGVGLVMGPGCFRNSSSKKLKID
eukprot:1091953-Rhodomonas_salina.1